MSEQVLRHLNPDCVGEWYECGARKVPRRPRPKRGRFIVCNKCGEVYPADEWKYQKALYDQWEMQGRLKYAMLEQKASRAMAAAMRDVLGEMIGTTDELEELADAALRGLRNSFLAIHEDCTAQFRWRDAALKAAQPVADQLFDILDGAFNNYRVTMSTGVQGGKLRYTIALEQREPAQEAAVRSRIESITLPPEFDELTVTFTEREAAA